MVDDNLGLPGKRRHLLGAESESEVLDGTGAVGRDLAVVKPRWRPLAAGFDPNVTLQTQQGAQPHVAFRGGFVLKQQAGRKLSSARDKLVVSRDLVSDLVGVLPALDAHHLWNLITHCVAVFEEHLNGVKLNETSSEPTYMRE